MAEQMTDLGNIVLQLENYFFVKGSLPLESVSAVSMDEGESAK